MLLIRSERIATQFASRIPNFRNWCLRKFHEILPWLKTSAVISAEMWIGDACCQRIENAQELNFARSNTMALTGLTTTGPLVHWLVNRLESIAPGVTPSAIITKVFLNCCFMPIMFGAALGSTSLLEGNDIIGASRKVRFQLLPNFTTFFKGGLPCKSGMNI